MNIFKIIDNLMRDIDTNKTLEYVENIGSRTLSDSGIDHNKSKESGKLFYTKCNRTFRKNTTAAVTAYECPIFDDKCKVCPFVEVNPRQRKGEILQIRECRAGELKPNHKNDYRTNNEDDASQLVIKSIDWNWIEEVRLYATGLDNVEGAYYTQDLSDCRKALSICFSKNKKGIKAKEHIVNKYFRC